MSIRSYLFFLLTGIVLIIAAALSYQSAYIFIDSIDYSMKQNLLAVGKKYPEEGKEEQVILGYHVTTNWQKVPVPVRQRFPEIPSEVNEHYSIFEDWIYIAPPKRAYSLMVVEREGQKIFVSYFNEHIHENKKEKMPEDDFFIDPMLAVVLIGVSMIVIFALFLIFTFRKVARPMEALQIWAKHLSIDNLDSQLPDFKFKELNALASLIHENLTSMAESITREQAFLGYASHELRTPIAVLRSNCALLEKVNPNPCDKEKLIRQRIERASLTMKSMTETLLWLSRKGETEMSVERVSVGHVVEQTQQELIYLLSGKAVTVKLEKDNSEYTLPLTPVVIVLNNLIRNAFQHTQAGHVDIVQRNQQVVITNTETQHDLAASGSSELGFGLGMQLVEKLTQQFNWQYECEQTEQGYRASITFE